MARGWGRGCCGRWRGAVSGRVCSSSPPLSIPGPHEVTGQDLKEDKEDQPAPQISPPPPAPLSPARPQRDGRGAQGEGGWGVVSRPTGGSQGWHWGHRVRRDSGPTREGCPGHSQSRYGWVGGEMPFKGPGRWPHVQKPGPGSRRRRSSSGSVPRPPPSGWLGRRGGLPSSGYTVRDNGAWSPLLWGAAITRKGTAFPPATCVPHYRTQRSHKMGEERAVSHCAKRGCVCVSVVPHECPLGSPGDTEQCPPGCSYSRRQGCLSPGVQNTPPTHAALGRGTARGHRDRHRTRCHVRKP